MYLFVIATVLTIACTTKPDPANGNSHPTTGLTEGPPSDTPEVDTPNEQSDDTAKPHDTGETTPPPLINVLSLSVETLSDCVVCATVQVSLNVAAPVTLLLGESGSASVPWVQSESSEHHTIPLLELHADTAYELEVRIDGTGGSIAGHTVFATESLPDIFPPITLEVGADIRQQPGLTLLTILEWSSPSARRFLVAALDHDGEVVWYHQLDHLVLALGLDEQMRIYTTDSTQKAVRIDPYGQTKTVWPVEDLGIPAVHHEIRPTEDGGMALLTTELRNIDGWWMEPMVYPASFNVVGDIFAVFDAEGHQTWSWSMLDHFDPLEHHTSDMHMNFWSMPPYLDVDDPKDWSHANTLTPRGDNWVASLRNLDWVMEINPDTDEVEWVFGHNGDFTLTDGGRWFSRQHRPSFPSDNTILMYDNGLDRADAEEDEEAFSRIVEYQLDTETMTATELWSWSGGEPYVSPIAGGVSRLENDNHLINDGAFYHGSYFAEDRWWPHYSARIREVVGTEDPEVIWEVSIGNPDDLEKTGWFVYRAERIDSLYPTDARPE
jgi:hypothetical protein